MLSFNTSYIKFGIIAVLFGFCLNLPAQSILISVSREFKDSSLVKKGSEININSQKANIIVQGWSKPMISIRVRVIFENASSITAKKELDFAKCNLIKTSIGINANNYFSLPPGINKLSSVVRIDYWVFAPDFVNIVLNNVYGSCEINDMNSFINLNNKYGKIQLSGVTGLIRVYSTLCTVNARNIGGDISFNGSNSEYSLENINGYIKIFNNVGKLQIRPGKELKNLNASCLHSEIDIIIKDFSQFNYNLFSKNAKILFPEEFSKYSMQQMTPGKLVYITDKNKPLIEVSTTYNNINMK